MTIPAPGTPAYNPAWYAATDIYLDPASGSDLNTGTSAAQAVKTMAEIVARYGSSSPELVFGQNLTIHQLSAQAVGVDLFFFTPKVSGSGYFAWIAAMPSVGSSFSPTTVTAKVASSTGNDLQMSGGLPAAMAEGQVIHNVTKSSYAMVQNVTSGVATITQPFAAAGLTTVVFYATLVTDDTWSASDSYQLLQPLTLNAEGLWADGGDSDSTRTIGGGWIQGIHVPDQSGAPANSALAFEPKGIGLVCSMCTFDPECVFDAEHTGSGIQCNSCLFESVLCFTGIYLNGGASDYTVLAALGCSVDADIILTDSFQVNGVHYIGRAHLACNLELFEFGNAILFPLLSAPLLWGSGLVNCGTGADINCSVNNQSGGTWASCLSVGGLRLNGVGTGTSYSAGVWTDGITLTPANLDTHGGLQAPRTGCRYA